MTAMREGLQLEYLLRRLAECPQEFTISSDQTKPNMIFPPAIVGDFFRDICGVTISREKLAEFHLNPSANNRNWLNLVLIACWLYHDEWFVTQKPAADSLMNLFQNHFIKLAKIVKAELFVTDPDRREEFARLCLHAAGYRPKGENENIAADRLKTLDSIERDRVIKAAKQVEKRAAEIRIAMAKQAAIEAASKMPRE
jgi:hypothetical protein